MSLHEAMCRGCEVWWGGEGVSGRPHAGAGDPVERRCAAAQARHLTPDLRGEAHVCACCEGAGKETPFHSIFFALRFRGPLCPFGVGGGSSKCREVSQRLFPCAARWGVQQRLRFPLLHQCKQGLGQLAVFFER